MERTCGECIACCTYLSSSEVPMKGLSHCKYSALPGPEEKGKLFLTGKYNLETDGCGNCVSYQFRPDVCREYGCSWLAGYGEEEDRPDRSGMLVDTIQKIENCLEAKPLWPDAQDQPAGRLAVERISRDAGKPVAVASFPERHMVRIVGRGVE